MVAKVAAVGVIPSNKACMLVSAPTSINQRTLERARLACLYRHQPASPPSAPSSLIASKRTTSIGTISTHTHTHTHQHWQQQQQHQHTNNWTCEYRLKNKRGFVCRLPNANLHMHMCYLQNKWFSGFRTNNVPSTIPRNIKHMNKGISEN